MTGLPGGPRDAAPDTVEVTAMARGLALCRRCEQLQAAPMRNGATSAAGAASAASDAVGRCIRCGARLALRTPARSDVTAACLLAATILYIPANVLPVMRTTSLLGDQSDTIVSGILHLADSGSWPLALLVFFASVMVPVMKLIALTVLMVAARRGVSAAAASDPRAIAHLHQRARLFRAVEFVGRWSMLDVFVVTLLVALVQFKALATIKAGPGALAFGGVVVLTMIAAQSFDPRRLWDPALPLPPGPIR